MMSSQNSLTPTNSQSSVMNYTIPSLPSSFHQGSSGSFMSQSSGLPDHGGDPNSPEMLKANIAAAREYVMRANSLARLCLSGTEQAYQSGTNPAQTAADFAGLQQALRSLADFLRITGVGALPAFDYEPPTTDPSKPPSSSSTSALPTEDELVADAGRNVQARYEKLKRSQESTAVVANLLNAPDGGSGPNRPVPSGSRS
ncbi:hypothetical protein BJ138DRAFT_1162981 [Hygrophoropsis aurantiaca]|uniref:Uncharacterized protein n=1 Tax=Hygrophoropsis aurantiaca TaxID=72124 RepID=A0ACB7ZZY5_9AGAM|nr:hypothetical protein BJ138DRAFT_1162981 [Hygrophoropsis aurantiaca]